MSKQKLSLCMIVRNEEEFIRQCLESVLPHVDEVVIVDTGSTDGTMSILTELQLYMPMPGFRIFNYVWRDDFAAARNYALSHCTGDWVLVLDADERITPEAAGLIRKAIKDAPPNCGGVECTLAYEHILPDGSIRADETLYTRLFRRHQGICFVGAVHEQITPTMAALGFTVIQSGVRIQHIGYAQSLEVMRGKSQRNLAILDRILRQDSGDDMARYHRANCLAYLGRWREAETELRQSIAGGFLPPHILAHANEFLREIEQGVTLKNQPMYTDEALVDLSLNYARYKIAQHLSFLPESERAGTLPLLALLDAVVAGDAVEASELISRGALLIEPQFLFECVNGGWNASLVPDPRARERNGSTRESAHVGK